MEVVRTEIDGVPVFWTGGGTGGDEYRAALVFRVGRADETLARGGLTHLVEHLALHAVGETEYHYNGAVDTNTTMFVTHGEAGKVAAFLTSLCDSLRELPVDRLDAEKKILRTEAESRDTGLAGQMLLWRYGAATYGLPAYDEHGLAAHTAEDVQAWAAHWFTRQNAALAIVGGPPPDGLALRLPDGERRPLPAPSSALPYTPAYFTANVKGVALNGVVPRTIAGTLYAGVLRRRLHRVLRRDGALSYTTDVDYAPRDGDTAHITAFADGLAEVRPELAERFLAEFDRMAAEPVGADELAEVADAARTRAASDDGRAARAVAHSVDELLGHRSQTVEQYLADLDAVKPQDLQDVGRAVLDGALLMLPHEQEPGDARFRPAPTASTIAVDGRVHTRPDEPRLSLVVGREGVTSLTGPELRTVRHDACAAVLAWPDGLRVLIGLDGLTVAVEPNLWADGARIVAEIDRHAPAGAVVRMPARPAEHVPERPEAAPAPEEDPLAAESPLTRAVAAVRGLRGRIGSKPGPAWDDAALAAALPAVRGGDLRPGLDLLARSRDDAEARSLYVENLTDAALGRGADLARLAADAPGDPDVQLWLGAVRVGEAWKARTGYRAEYITRERFARFWRLLALAGGPLQKAAELLPADPVPWDHLQRYGNGLQLERHELDRMWDELKARHPSLYAGHVTRVQILCAKWKGSDAEVLGFAERTVADAEPGDPVTAVLTTAHMEVAPDESWEMLDAYMARPEVHAAVVGAADRWLAAHRPHPRDLEAHHFFGAAFFRAGDRERARRHLSRVGRTAPPLRAWGYAPDPDRLLARARREVGA
ncbi:hypothetical protein [Actinomadura sp. WAC 06369]|uniref:hypothetical protein n=1 Tax=Actinomadura sp. WAC 06369 TaxID=2203193 RepID=UPI000F773375|nr:hypothetical protein [Actinomadura sp. WAC 06369]